MGIPGIIAGIILSVIFWKWTPDTTIPLYLAVIVGIILFSIIIILLNAFYETYNNKSSLPKIITSIQENNKLIILLKPSDLFSIGALVSFYSLDNNNYERLLGFGHVLNIQDNNKIIQVELTKTLDGTEDLIKNIKEKNKDVLQKLLVKPHISKYCIDYVN